MTSFGLFDKIYINKGVIGIKNFRIEEYDINRGELIGVIGPNGSGKTYLLENIIGRYNNIELLIDDIHISKYSLEYKKNNIVVVFNDDKYYTNTPLEELKYFLSKLSRNNIDNDVCDFIELFDLEKIIKKTFSTLNVEDKIYTKILSLLIIKPKIFCIDDMLTYISKDRINKILNYIKNNKIILISVCSNLEDLLYFDRVLVMNKGKFIKYDTVRRALEDEEMFKVLGLSLPFMFEINKMLKSYDLIQGDHYIMKDLVNVLWK